MAIRLTGYERFLDNEVFMRNKEVTTDDGQLVLLKEVVLPSRYTTPSEDEVVEYLRKKAGEVESAATLVLPGNIRPKGRSLLEVAIMNLPDKIRRDINQGEKLCVDFIRQHTRAPAVKDMSRDETLFVRYGLIPVDIINGNQEQGSLNSAEWYSVALCNDTLREQGLGERWHLKLLLIDGGLPLRDDMDVLLRHGTHGSKTLDVSRINYLVEEVSEVLCAIYDGLSTGEERAQLTDITDKVLEELTLQPVSELHKMVQNVVVRLRKTGGDGRIIHE